MKSLVSIQRLGERLNNKRYKLSKMEQNTFKWLSIMLTLIIGRNEILSFLKSFFEGMSEFLNSLPPMAILVMLIIFIWLLANKK